MNPDITFLVLGGIALLFAAAAAIAEARAVRRHRAFVASSARAEGVVDRISLPYHLSRNKPTSEDARRTVPVVRFRAANGVEYEFNAESAPHVVGARVGVAYEAALPSNAQLSERRSGLGCAIVLALLSLAAFGWAFLG